MNRLPPGRRASLALLAAVLWHGMACKAATLVLETESAQAADSNPGAAALPLKTLGAAMRRLKPGDEVVVGDGDYRETVTVPRLVAAAGGAMTSIRARNAAKAIVRGSDPVTGWAPAGDGRPAVDWRGRSEPAQVFAGGQALRQIGGSVFDGYPDNALHELAGAHGNEGGVWPGRVAGLRAGARRGRRRLRARASRASRPARGHRPAHGADVPSRFS